MTELRTNNENVQCFAMGGCQGQSNGAILVVNKDTGRNYTLSLTNHHWQLQSTNVLPRGKNPACGFGGVICGVKIRREHHVQDILRTVRMDDSIDFMPENCADVMPKNFYRFLAAYALGNMIRVLCPESCVLLDHHMGLCAALTWVGKLAYADPMAANDAKVAITSKLVADTRMSALDARRHVAKIVEAVQFQVYDNWTDTTQCEVLL